jgi:hypothetical protein
MESIVIPGKYFSSDCKKVTLPSVTIGMQQIRELASEPMDVNVYRPRG